jgi:integrase/recombinase XerD
VFVRQGKGAKDRYVPIGERAVAWARRYGEEVRPRLAKYPDTGVLFLSASGEALCAEWLTRTVSAYVKAGAPGKKGSCHLFRHSAATLMLDAGADVRYVAEYLGPENLESTTLYTRVSVKRLRAVHRAAHRAGK